MSYCWGFSMIFSVFYTAVLLWAGKTSCCCCECVFWLLLPTRHTDSEKSVSYRVYLKLRRYFPSPSVSSVFSQHVPAPVFTFGPQCVLASQICSVSVQVFFPSWTFLLHSNFIFSSPLSSLIKLPSAISNGDMKTWRHGDMRTWRHSPQLC